MRTTLKSVLSGLSSAAGRLLLFALAICAPLHAALAAAAFTPNSISMVGGNNQSGAPSTQLSNPLAVAFSNSSYVTKMEWKVTSGNAAFDSSGSTDISVYNGNPAPGQISSVPLYLGSTPGTVNVQAIMTACADVSCFSNNPPQTVTFSETIITPSVLQMQQVSGNNQSGAPGTAVASPLVVQLVPQSGFDGPGNGSISWTVLRGTATIVESGGSTYTQNYSLPTSSNTPFLPETLQIHVALGNTAGPVIVRAFCQACAGSVPGTSQYYVQDFNLTVAATAVTLQKISGDNQSGAVGTASSAPLVVQLGPPGGFPTGQPVAWNIVSGQASLSAASTPIDNSGMASVDFTYGASAGPITIEASVGSAKVDFTATAFVAGASAASGNNQVGVVGTTLQPFVLQLTAPAAGGQPANLGGVTVNWSVNQGGGGLVSTTTTTDASGKSSDTLTLGPNPGTNSVTATIPGMGNVTVSFTATAIPAAASIASAGGGNQSGIAGGVLQPFSVQVVANGKGVPGLSVNWSVNQGGGTLSAPISITDANGNASDTLTLGSNPGVNSVTASIAGIGNVVFTAIASATVAGGSQFTIVSGNNQALIPGQASQALVVKLLGPQGNPISGAYVAWTVSGSSGTLVNASTPTDANGQAQNQLTVILPGAYTVTATLANAPGIPALSFSFNNAVANLPGLTPAQIGVAKAIDKACPALAGMAGGQLTPPQRDLLQRCSEIVVGSGNDPQQVPDALNQMLNNKALPQRELANSMQLGQFGNLNTRLGELRQGATGINLSGLTLSQDGRSLPLAMLGDAFRKDPKQDDEIGKDFERWGFFATGMVDRGGFDAMASRPGFDYHNASLTAGVDYRFNADFVAGVALGYNSNHSSFDLNAGKVDVDGYSLNGYFTWYHNNDFYIEGSAIYNSLSYDMTRNIVYQIDSLSGPGLTSVNQSANASPNGNEGSLALSIGKDFNRKAWTFSPYLRGVYSHLSLDGFSESIADPNAPGAGLATSVDARSMTSMLGVLGGRISYTTSYDWGVLVPNAVIEWNHEFRNDPQTVVTRFLADPTQTPIVLSDTPPDSSYFNLGFGLNAVLPQGRSAFVYYEHVVGYTGMHEDRLSIGIRIEF